jgi:putative oxidoreductase
VALVMAGYCFATALIFHRNFADFEQELNFMKNLSMAGGLLQIFVFGGGAYSVDGRRD